MPSTVLIEPTVRVKKPFRRRLVRDNSQSVRRTVQVFFLLLNIYIGISFFLFVRQFERTESLVSYTRPPGVEGWLPVAGLMNLKSAILTASFPAVHPATLVLLATFVTLSFLFRKAFCGWLCPVGTISDWLSNTGRSTFGRNFALPRWLDIVLRSLKYILLGLFLFAVGTMSVEALSSFLQSPYGLIADVKMLNFFRSLRVTGAVVIATIALLSIFIRNFWCRYLCPYGALMGIASIASPLWIRRSPEKCIDCAKCAKACPAGLPVDTKLQIRSPECLGCLKCVSVCPAEGALDLSMFGLHPAGRKRTEPTLIAVAILVIFFGAVGWAKYANHWDSPISVHVYRELIPNAGEYEHPR